MQKIYSDADEVGRSMESGFGKLFSYVEIKKKILKIFYNFTLENFTLEIICFGESRFENKIL